MSLLVSNMVLKLSSQFILKPLQVTLVGISLSSWVFYEEGDKGGSPTLEVQVLLPGPNLVVQSIPNRATERPERSGRDYVRGEIGLISRWLRESSGST